MTKYAGKNKGVGAKGAPTADGLERMAIRLRPGYSKLLAKMANHAGTDKSKFVRKAVFHYLETHPYEFDAELLRELHELRKRYRDEGVI